MVFGRLLRRLRCKGVNFDIIAKAVPSNTPWFGNCKSIIFDLENAKVKSGNTNDTPAVTLHHSPGLIYFRVSNNAREEEKTGTSSEESESKHQLPPRQQQKDMAKEATPMRYVNAETFENALQNINYAFVVLHESWRGRCSKCQLLKTLHLFVDVFLVNISARPQLMTSYGDLLVTDHVLFDTLVDDRSYGRKEADLASFIHSQPSVYQQAKNAREAGFGGSVVLVFDSDFENMIGDAKPTLVMFYASFCDHCVICKPAYSKLATTLKGEGKMKAIAIDAADNPRTADLAGIQTLPTFKMYKAGQLIEDYTGDRSYDDFLAFCKKHAPNCYLLLSPTLSLKVPSMEETHSLSKF